MEGIKQPQYFKLGGHWQRWHVHEEVKKVRESQGSLGKASEVRHLYIF